MFYLLCPHLHYSMDLKENWDWIKPCSYIWVKNILYKKLQQLSAGRFWQLWHCSRCFTICRLAEMFTLLSVELCVLWFLQINQTNKWRSNPSAHGALIIVFYCFLMIQTSLTEWNISTCSAPKKARNHYRETKPPHVVAFAVKRISYIGDDRHRRARY